MLKDLSCGFDEMVQEAKQEIIEMLECYSGYLCDLHNEVFNSDFYLINSDEAKSELEKIGVFDCVELVQEYEQEHFGQIYTKLSDPIKLVNMVYYVIGDYVIQEYFADNEIYENNYNNVTDDDTNKELIKLLK